MSMELVDKTVEQLYFLWSKKYKLKWKILAGNFKLKIYSRFEEKKFQNWKIY